MSSSPDLQTPPGIVELREDVPLKPSGGGARLCAGGPRLILAAFAVLTAAVTIALFTQIYYGDYEVVPHGSVSSSAAACSRAGTAALRAGGRAVDAAAAAALCLAVLAPHRTSLDASGSLVYWEYRSSRTQLPTVVEWGGVEQVAGSTSPRPPRLLVGLAALHEKFGVLSWAQVLQPAINIAREGFPVSDGLSLAAQSRGFAGYAPAALRTEPALADYLESLQLNTTTELCTAWSCTAATRWREPRPAAAARWRVWAAGAGGALAADALHSALNATADPSIVTPASALKRAVASLQAAVRAAGAGAPRGVASGLAAVDSLDTYAALVTGLSVPFGSEAGSASSSSVWIRDTPTAPLDLAPAIITDETVCGTRYVMGAESAAALAEGATNAVLGGSAGAVDAVEIARVVILPDGSLALEPGHPPPELPGLPTLPTLNSSTPLSALNFVQQVGDALLSHADSRGGGLASRF